MKNTLFFVFFALVGIFVVLQHATIVDACPTLKCSNFTNSEKKADCRYIMRSDLSKNEKQDLLCELWHGTYGFQTYQPPQYSLNVDLSKSYEEIDNSRLILAGKILTLEVFSYLIFSLTKHSFFAKWLNVVY